MKHMSSQKPTEVLMDLLSMVPLLEIGAIQLMCRVKEVSSSGAGNIVAMELASDDTIFAPGGQLGGRVRELIQLESFGVGLGLVNVHMIEFMLRDRG